MKTSHFEERIAFRVVPTAQERDERTQRELATLDIDLGGEWLVPPADCAGTGHPPGDGGATFTIGCYGFFWRRTFGRFGVARFSGV